MILEVSEHAKIALIYESMNHSVYTKDRRINWGKMITNLTRADTGPPAIAGGKERKRKSFVYILPQFPYTMCVQQSRIEACTHPKVGRAGGQDDPVGADELSVCGQGDVHQALLLQKGVHHGEDGGPVVVPFEAVLLVARGARHLALPHTSLKKY